MSRTRCREMAAGLWLLVTVAACSSGPSGLDGDTTLEGTLRAGADLGEVKQHCAEGLYLVADDGAYLVNQTTMLLLRVAEGDEQPMYADRRYLNERVQVTAADPVARPECDALICGCETYVLVGAIRGL